MSFFQDKLKTNIAIATEFRKLGNREYHPQDNCTVHQSSQFQLLIKIKKIKPPQLTNNLIHIAFIFF